MNATSLNHLFMQALSAVCIVNGKDYKIELVNERVPEFSGKMSDIIGCKCKKAVMENRNKNLILKDCL